MPRVTRPLSGEAREGLGVIASAARAIADTTQLVKVKARHKARTIAYSVNPGLQIQRRRKALLASGQLVMGRHSYFTPIVMAYKGETNKVVIGAFCSVDPDARIFVGGNHRPDWATTYALRVTFDLPRAHEDGHPMSNGDVIIGNDVWIATGATILSGVRIGNGAVIGASAVVAGHVAPYAIVVGNPAREVRKRFSDEHIAMLEEIAWWDWPLERIIENVDLLCSGDIDALHAAHRRMTS